MAAPSATTHPTLIDWAQRLDPNGRIAAIAELFTQNNAILEDAVYMEGNLPTGHRTTIRTGIPAGTWRRLNYGIAPQKSSVAQVTDTIGMLENYAEVDKELADLNGNTAEFRASEDMPILEGMSQTLATTLFYGDTDVDPEKFLGLAARYPSLGDPSGKVGTSYMNQVISAAGSTANVQTSMWLIVWGPNTVHMIFPKGSKVGIQSKDLGEVTLIDSAGGQLQGYRTHYQVKAGLCVRDWRYVVRIGNVEGFTTAFDHKLLIQAYNTIPNFGMGRAVFYCNRNVKNRIDIAACDKSNGFNTIEDRFGKPVTTFWGIPIKMCDALIQTEAVLTT